MDLGPDYPGQQAKCTSFPGMPDPSRLRPFHLAPADTAALGKAFRDAGFDEPGVCAALGIKGIASVKDLTAEIAFRRTSGPEARNALIRLFVIGSPVPRDRAEAALGAPLAKWIAGGVLAEVEGRLYAAVKITPIGGLLLAFDRTWEGQAAETPDHVMGPSDSARLLSSLLIGARGGDALDVGTGCGYLAFLAARDAKRVVATDLNARACAFVEFNAALNGIRNVEARAGDMFAPVAGESFDLIVSNPPFVISPEDRLVYLNGGMKADEFCRRMAERAGAYLRTGGHFQMLCNWVENEGTDWRDRLAGWFAGGGCDAWALRSSTTAAADYAQNWLDLGKSLSDSDRAERLAAWLAYYREEGISAIGGGAVIMRKRAGSDHWFRAFDAPDRIAGPGGEDVRARMDALDFLARRAAGDDALLDAVLRVSPQARLTQECLPGDGGWALEKAQVRLIAGLAYREEVDAWFAELMAACDGSRTLRQAVALTETALGLAPGEAPAETAEIVRQLVDEGFLLPPAAG